MARLFKVWCNKRKKKSTVICEPTVSAIISKAVQKLNFEVSVLVYEDGGTVVDDDVLQVFNNWN